MRKTFLMLFATLLFAALPAFAQHGSHASGGHASSGGHGFSGGSHAAGTQSHPATRSGSGYNYSRGDIHGGARAHWVGGRFEDHFFAAHWGAYNRFYFGGCNWWGPQFYVGSYFWYNGAYFEIVDPIDPLWYDEEVYVDYYDGGYYLVNPFRPGIRFAVRVRF
jgi:hypothetical protein